jgi:ABC-type branched-chain amino acid transport systems, ATPase component
MLEVSELHVRYDTAEAVRGVSFSVRQGEIVALLGSNGAGKTTILRAVAGLKNTFSGEIALEGKRVEHIPTHKRVGMGIGLVPEGKDLFPYMTVGENLGLGAFLRRDKAAIELDREELLSHFPVLKERLGQRAWSLSGGEQQMLAIGRALMARPKILLLDEPSLGLSPKMVTEIARMITHLTARGIAVLLVEQNARLALGVSHRGYVLERGSIVLEGEAGELLDSEHVKRAYLGR